jgi:hypothetical protein
MLTRVNPNDPPNTWPRPYPGSISELDFKIMIITIFILILTPINGKPHSWSGSTPKLGFKNMITTTFILTLTWINPSRPKPCLDFPQIDPLIEF